MHQKKLSGQVHQNLQHNDLPCVGLQGDGYFRPMQTQGSWLDYTGCVMSIDPSGKGKR